MRLDKELVARGLARSRSDAQARIDEGAVTVNGTPALRASADISPIDTIDVATPGQQYVSRGGVKLAAALDAFSVDVVGLRCIDIGASTGGFTDCLLQRGAASVCAVDVGHDQMAASLRDDPRVMVYEGVNARSLSPAEIGGEGSFDLAVVDVSFISLTLLLPSIAGILRPGGRCIALVKPQFEVGVGGLGKGGIVRDHDKRRAAVEKVVAAGAASGLVEEGRIESPIAGGDGNLEYLVLFSRQEAAREIPNGIG